MRIVRAVLIAWFVVIFVPRAFGQAKIAAQPVKALRFGKLWDGRGKTGPAPSSWKTARFVT